MPGKREDKSIYHKNLMPVVYVTADVAGAIESPVYAILKLSPMKIKIGRQLNSHGNPPMTALTP